MKYRKIQVVSLSFNNKSADEILKLVEKEAQQNCDIIVLPEMWMGDKYIETIDISCENSGVTGQLQNIAKTYGVYILNSTYRETETTPRLNSGALIGRDGTIIGIYDKNYPYWDEYDLKPPACPGSDVPVFETDFGRVGIAICFDANFPSVWEELAEKGADIVFWTSAYSGGSSLQAHAINHHYYIVSSTLCNDCAVIDITGKEIYYQKSDSGVNISRVEIDMNREIFHENFNMGSKLERLLNEHAEITVESHLEREQWFVLHSKNEGVQIREIAAQYSMEELRAYKRRSRDKGIIN